MKSVGIITLHRVLNFGAVLQAYALRRVVRDLGLKGEFIDFQPPVVQGAFRLFCVPRRVASVKKNWQTLTRLGDHWALRAKFRRFFQERMGLGRRPRFRTLAELERGLPRYDVYLSGSDMIWNPVFLNASHGGCGQAYYLDFVRGGRGRKVAYASSFGVTEIPDAHRERIASYLGDFDHLSCREECGCGLIEHLIGRTAAHVFDPTLLLSSEQYDEIAVAPAVSKPFILVYPMEPSDLFCRLARKVQELQGLPLVAVVPCKSSPEKFGFADHVVYDAGPAEFLGWMKAASFVCTNSFHGTSFALIYRKQFLGVPDSVSNIRAFNLLQRVGLTSRQTTQPEVLHSAHPLLEPIDYSIVEPRLQEAKDRSLEYLKGALA